MNILTLLQKSGADFLGPYVSRRVLTQLNNGEFDCSKMRKGVYQCQSDNIILFFHEDVIDTIEIVFNRFQLSNLIEWDSLPLDRESVLHWLKHREVDLIPQHSDIVNSDSIFTVSGAEIDFANDRLERIRFTFE